MTGADQPITILMAEDDPDDRLLVKEAFEESRLLGGLHFVEDGDELMDYLHHRGRYEDPDTAPPPSLILLDLNMPRKDGREALEEIKGHAGFRRIPVVVFTTSQEERDVNFSYDKGASSYITKPASYKSLVKVIKTLGRYWFDVAELPCEEGSS